MMAKTKTQPKTKMKLSGIDWLGKIPESWDIKRIKYVANQRGDKADSEQKQDYVGLAAIESWTGKFSKDSDSKEKSNKGKLFFSSDVLFGKLRPYLAKVWLATFSGVCSGEFIVLEKNEYTNSQFIKYRLLSHDFISIVDNATYGAKMPRVEWDFVGNLKIALPPKQEQKQIADFLDEKTGVIDSLVQKNNQLIEKLKEYRQSLISRVVTKGLSPDTEMKSSDIDWLGEIPEDWEVTKLRRVSDIVLGKMLQNNQKNEDEEHRKYLRAQNIRWEAPDLDNVKKMWFSENEREKYKLEKGDLLVSEGGEVGRTCIWNNEIPECYIQNSINRVRVKEDNIEKYFLYLLETLGKSGYFDSIVNKVSIAHLTKEKLARAAVLVPPKKEQKQIADFLDEKTQKIDEAINKLQNSNKLLKEYRQSLISNVVTGKIRIA